MRKNTQTDLIDTLNGELTIDVWSSAYLSIMF